MKKIRCPKCDNWITFDESRMEAGHALAFHCPFCGKDFSIRLKPKEEKDVQNCPFGHIVVVENIFCKKQIFPLQSGENMFGRRCKGTEITSPIETGDMSMDRKHCVITVEQRNDKMICFVKDFDSVTGTFVQNDILQKNERRNLVDGDIITIGATTLIFKSGEIPL